MNQNDEDISFAAENDHSESDYKINQVLKKFSLSNNITVLSKQVESWILTFLRLSSSIIWLFASLT